MSEITHHPENVQQTILAVFALVYLNCLCLQSFHWFFKSIVCNNLTLTPSSILYQLVSIINVCLFKIFLYLVA